MNKKIPNYISKKVSDYTEELSENVSKFDLTSTNPTVFFSKKKYSYNPDPHGNFKLRKKISKLYKKRNIEVEPNSIFLTTGTSESISFLLKLFCNPTDEVLIPSPGYPLFEILLELESFKYLYYKYDEYYENENVKWKLNIESIEKCITINTKLLILVNPNNPLGVIINESDWLELKNIQEKYGIIIIVDEVFTHYPIGKKIKNNYIPSSNIIFLDGVSKYLGLPGMKISWMVFKGDDEFLKNSIFFMEIITDAYLTVSTISQSIINKLINIKNKRKIKINKIIERNYNHTINKFLFSKIVTVNKIDFGWYLPLKIETGLSEELILLELFRETGVKVLPGSFFHFPNGKYIVISLLVKPTVFEKGIDLIHKFFLSFEYIEI